MIKLPYGISNFETLVSNGYIYIDRTPYVEQLEQMNQRYLVMVRPRRFGKSLFLSVLEHYYGLEYRDRFDQLFGSYYIGQHPTPSANSYLILKFDFSQIDTSSFENTFASFLQNVKESAKRYVSRYPQFFAKEELAPIDELDFPSHVIQRLLTATEFQAPNQKIYLLVDEYDHFANELLSFHFEEFNKIVGQNGFVRKFYESIKTGTQSGIIDRLFITGVSPLTLDSLTSGFNMSTNITLEEEFNHLMGFTQSEVLGILRGIEIPQEEEEEVMALMKDWYDGYLFSTNAQGHVYNSDMVLYFASIYAAKRRYPEELLDANIASDYRKIRKLFTIKDKEIEHLAHLDELLKKGELVSKLVRQFELNRRFDREDFISLLFYTGIITIDGKILDQAVFKMPNYVIKQLYYQYFHQVMLERTELVDRRIKVERLIATLALENELEPLIQYTQEILQELSVRDKQNFDEKYVKVIFTSAFYNSGIYTIHNELEVKKSATEKGFVDLLLQKRPPYETKYQFLIEFKYVKKEDAAKAASIKAEAIKQLEGYLHHDPFLQELKQLKAYVVVFVGNEGEYVEVKN